MPQARVTKEYTAARQKAWAKANPERARASQLKYLQGKPHARKSTVLKARYGITLEQRDAMLAQQGGCAICLSQHSGSPKDWMTDHDHITGQVRGILCIQCNILLGAAKDRISTLLEAVKYLRAGRTDA